MKKKIFALTLAVVLCLPLFVFAQNAEEDIQILKVLNLFKLSNDQLTKLVPIIEEGIKSRAKNLGEIRKALVSGKTYGELKDTYVSKLEKTNDKIVGKIKAILEGDEQKQRAEMVFDIFTGNEMGTLMQIMPTMLSAITGRLSILQDYGVISMPEDSSEMMGPVTELALGVLDSFKAKAREFILSNIIKQRTIELIKERLAEK